jgi:SAM-dependent methyltransferase
MSPNADQMRYWNEEAAPSWVRHADEQDRLMGPLGRLAMTPLEVRPGQRVLDVGCGCGGSTFDLAALVGASGHVLGVDISAPMLALARERAAAAGLTQVAFEEADAQTATFEGFDAAFSRFGVMFFDDPTAAFANIAAGLRPKGRLAFVCFRDVSENPWLFMPVMAAAGHLTLPPLPAPGEPGPFAFADGERLGTLLAQGGFTDIEVAATDTTVKFGEEGELEKCARYILDMGPTRRAFEEATPEVQSATVDAVSAALAPYDTADGIKPPAGLWLVSARVA